MATVAEASSSIGPLLELGPLVPVREGAGSEGDDMATVALALDLSAKGEEDGEEAGDDDAKEGKKDDPRNRPWTDDEDKLVRSLVDMHGTKCWSLIAASLPGRTGKQCRERWHNQLDPGIKKDGWTSEEDRILLEAHRQLGNRWAEIAKLLPGRTDNVRDTPALRSHLTSYPGPPTSAAPHRTRVRLVQAIKNHWNSALRRELRKLNRQKSAIIPALAQGVEAPGRVEHVAAKLRQQQKGARAAKGSGKKRSASGTGTGGGGAGGTGGAGRGRGRSGADKSSSKSSDEQGASGEGYDEASAVDGCDTGSTVVVSPTALASSSKAVGKGARASLVEADVDVADATAAAMAVTRGSLTGGLNPEQDAKIARAVRLAVDASSRLTKKARSAARADARAALSAAASASASTAGSSSAADSECPPDEGGSDEEGADEGELPALVDSQALKSNLSALNKMWQDAAHPPSSEDVTRISAQVSWLQEFCEHLVENSLTRSLLQQSSSDGSRRPEGGKRKRVASGAEGPGGAHRVPEGATRVGELTLRLKVPGAKRKRPAKDAGNRDAVSPGQPMAAADSDELIDAFQYHEGGPPTPLEEPLGADLRAALGRGSSGLQISSMLDSANSADAPSGIDDSSSVYARMPVSPAAASGLLSPLSPEGVSFDVDELLRIVGTPVATSVAEVLQSPRGAPVVCLSPQTRGPLEALWLSQPHSSAGSGCKTPREVMPPPPDRPPTASRQPSAGGAVLAATPFGASAGDTSVEGSSPPSVGGGTAMLDGDPAALLQARLATPQPAPLAPSTYLREPSTYLELPSFRRRPKAHPAHAAAGQAAGRLSGGRRPQRDSASVRASGS